MAARSPHFTALEVGTLVTEGDDDTEFLFPGSDDVVDVKYDPLEREQGKYLDVDNEPAFIYTSPCHVESLISPSPPETSPEPSPEMSSRSEGQTCGRERRVSRGGQQANSCGRRGRSHGKGSSRSSAGPSSRYSLTPEREKMEWSDNFNGITVEPFDKPTGPAVPVSSNPTGMFLSFFTPALIDQIVMETNRYAVECFTVFHTGNGPVPEWKTNAEEILAYFGFSIYMGINWLPDLYDYWSTSDSLHYFPVASRIPRKRFLEIQRYLHFTENDNVIPPGQPGYDRLAKIRPVVESVRQRFLENSSTEGERDR